MISLEDVRDRCSAIEWEGTPFFLSVSDAVSFADAVDNFDAIPPAAYVSIGTERAGKNMRASGGRFQRVDSTVSVIFALGAQRADGERADPIEIARGLVIASLTGFTPEGCGRALDFTSYSLRAMGGGLVWGECIFGGVWDISGPA